MHDCICMPAYIRMCVCMHVRLNVGVCVYVCKQVGVYTEGEHWCVSLLPNTKNTLLQHMLQATRSAGLRGLETSQTQALALQHSYSATKAELFIPSYRSVPYQWGTRQSTLLYLACGNRGVLLHSLTEDTHISLASAHKSMVASSVETKAANSLTIRQFMLQDAYLFQHKLWDPRHVWVWRRKARNANRRDL